MLEEVEKTHQETVVEEHTSPTDFSSFDDNASPLGFLSNKLVSLVIGILVIALLVPFIIFVVSKSHKSTNPSKTAIATKSITPTPTPIRNKQQSQPKITKKPTPTPQKVAQTTKGGLPVATLGTNTYTDPVFGYSLKLPVKWEAYKSAGSGTAYQMAFHPAGSSDRPFTIGAQSGISEDQWINAEYGASYPRATTQIAGRTAILIKTNTYQSYFTHDNTYTYEISEALSNPQYYSPFQSMLSSLTFSK